MQVGFFKNPCNWYFLIWVIQIVHDPLGLYGDQASVIVLFSLYVWSLYYFFVTILSNNNSAFLKYWNIMYVLFMVYGIYELLVSTSHSRLYVIDHCTSMLPLYPFYVFSQRGYLSKQIFKFWSLVFIPVAFINFYYGQEMAYQNLLAGQEAAGVTNNMGYSIALIIPMFYFWKDRPIVQYVGLAVITILTVLALKRGAIMLAGISLVMILLHLRKTNKGSSKFVYVILGLCFILGIGYFIQKQAASNDYMMERYTQTINGDTSERSHIYSDAYNYFFNEMNPFQMLFGIGANGCVKAINSEAHNDWLETLVSLGLFGFFVFFKLWANAYQFYKRIYNPEIKFLFGLVALLLFIRTFFSMSIGDIYLNSTSILGYCMVNANNQKNEII